MPFADRNADTVGAILCRNDTILLGLRSPRRRSCPRCWDVIGGHVEPGEAPPVALARELREEIGVTSPDLAWLGDLTYPGDAGRPLLLRLYRVDRWVGEPRLANYEHVDLRWFAPAKAARLVAVALEGYRPIFAALAA